VTPATQTVDTSRLSVTFDLRYPEVVLDLVVKDWDPGLGIATNAYSEGEFWGQTARGLEDTGFIRPGAGSTHSWQVTAQSARFAQVTITSQAPGQPEVRTRYTFVADQPWFAVDRTIRFSTLADTASYQAYLPRVLFLEDYRALRWRDAGGNVVQRGFCASPCVNDSWDGHWVEMFMRLPGQLGLGVTSLYPPASVAGLPLVRGAGPFSPSGWAQPRVPAGAHTADRTWSQLVAFTTAPDDVAAIDALWTAYANGTALADAPPASGGEPLRLSASPNPAHGPATLAWNNPVAARVTLDVLDVAGRRVRRILDGIAPAGPQRASWDGRADGGARVAPGLYLARLVTPTGASTTSLVRAN
jgi:hypothetical protein